MKPVPVWRLTGLRALLLIGFVGATTFAVGLANQFVGDDFAQVVNSATVHSLSHLPGLFSGSTFYDDTSAGHLSGVYYRPLMLTVYAAIYHLAGLNAYAFHLVQLLLYLVACGLLFLVFRRWFARGVALALATIFTVHPMNSQAVYSIADLQEPLYLMFGLLAVWLLMRARGRWQFIALACGSLLLSMLSKETGLLFGAMALGYVWMFERRSLRNFAVLAVPALALYAALKFSAVGLARNPVLAPVDQLNLPQRLANIPALVSFYLAKFVWPQHIAHAYYWVVRAPTVAQFWLPLALVLALAAAIIAGARAVRLRNAQAARVYAFFAAWFALGLLFHAQIVPLDLTVSLPWFMFSMVGLLGLIGTVVQTLVLPLPSRWLVAVPVAIIALLAVRSAVRGPDWSGTYILAARDLAVSAQDYPSANLLSYHLSHLGQFQPAVALAQQSAAIFPTAGNLDSLGVAEAGLGHCAAASTAFARSLALAPTGITLRHRAQLTALCVAHTASTYPRPQ